MSLWLVRAGRYGEFESRFVADSRIYLTWGELGLNACQIASRNDLSELLRRVMPDASVGRIRNHTGQIWAFLREMHSVDLVAVPSKKKPEFLVGEIVGDCMFDGAEPEAEYRHFRPVKWLRTIARASIDKDLLYSFGAIMTICEISRNDAEARIRAMVGQAHFQTDHGDRPAREATPIEGPVDYEELARDEIAALIIRRFKGHDLERLVESVLKAQGYVTRRSSIGADKGIDILAGSGPLGFGSPKICVQVKSEQTPVDHPTFSQLLGTMHDVGAEQGLLVSWGGFKSTVEKEIPRNFFRVRFWDQEKLIEQILEHYDQLDEEIRAELPLKRIWTVVPEEPEAEE